jgi:peptidoglycan hydrolase CwlO-like protein
MTEIKALKSENFITCKLSYDSLLSSIKLFLHNFGKLTDSEKAEYKSLTNYVKQLSKCTVQELNKPKKNNKKIITKSSDDVEEIKEEIKEIKEEIKEIKEEVKEEVKEEIKEETKKVVRKVVPKQKSKVQPPPVPVA